MKVLVIEDNPVLRERIGRQFLKTAVIDEAANGEQGLTRSGAGYDVIILDLGLPDMSGLEVCQKIREGGIETPILVLTGEADVASRVTLLNAGADDYLIKPFHGEELRARVSALARRTPKRLRREVLELADLVVNPENRTVERSGRAVYLTRTEFDILEYLLLNRNRVLSREMILDRVWHEDADRAANVVDVHIKRLRDKIYRPFASALIQTIHGLGYTIDGTQPHGVTGQR